MPRASGVYTLPPGTDGVPGATISSAKYNTFIHDVETDLNTPRPIVAGGTGATTAADARTNLGIDTAIAANAMVPDCGRLTWVSQTQLAFKPFNGNKIKIAGTLYDIPDAGIAGLGNTNISINGTAGQSLVNATMYLICARVVGGVVTADYMSLSSIAVRHMVDTTAGNKGVEVWTADGITPDPSRTIIGIVYAAGGTPGQFFDTPVNRLVRSWFNRVPLSCFLLTPSARSTTSSAMVSTGDVLQFVNWAGETPIASVFGNVSCSTPAISFVGLASQGPFETQSLLFASQVSMATVGHTYLNGGIGQPYQSESSHQTQLMLATQGGTMTLATGAQMHVTG